MHFLKPTYLTSFKLSLEFHDPLLLDSKEEFVNRLEDHQLETIINLDLLHLKVECQPALASTFVYFLDSSL